MNTKTILVEKAEVVFYTDLTRAQRMSNCFLDIIDMSAMVLWSLILWQTTLPKHQHMWLYQFCKQSPSFLRILVPLGVFSAF